MNCATCDHFRADIEIAGVHRDRMCLERNRSADVVAHFAHDSADGCPAFAPLGASAIEPAVLRHLDRLAAARGWSDADMVDAIRVAALYPSAADWRPISDDKQRDAA